jgi:hypothetical protein
MMVWHFSRHIAVSKVVREDENWRFIIVMGMRCKEEKKYKKIAFFLLVKHQ